MTDQSRQGPDARQLQEQEHPLPRVPFPGKGGQALRVYVAPDAHAKMHEHASEDTSVEVCGVLVGQWQQDDDGPYARITASIRGEAATNKFAEVTFTHETWARINQEMDQHHANEAIVGWYHTHPDFGVFLSDRDRFIHEHFFSGPGQLALVIDPVRKTEGFFIWHDGKPTLSRHYWVGGDLRVAPPSPEQDSHDSAAGAGDTGGHARREGEHIALGDVAGGHEEPVFLGTTLKVSLVIVLFLLGWLLGSGRRHEDRVLAYKGAIQKVESEGLLKFVTPQLQSQVRHLNRSLDLLAADLQHWQPASPTDSTEADGDEQPMVSVEKQARVRAGNTLRDIRVKVRELQQFLTVTAAEAEGLQRVLAEIINRMEAQRKAEQDQQQRKPDTDLKAPATDNGKRAEGEAETDGDHSAPPTNRTTDHEDQP